MNWSQAVPFLSHNIPGKEWKWKIQNIINILSYYRMKVRDNPLEKNPTSDTHVLMWIYNKRKVDKLKSYLFKSTLNCLKTNFHKIPVSFTPNVMCSQRHWGGELALFLPLVNELLQYAALRHNLWETCPYYDIAQDGK